MIAWFTRNGVAANLTMLVLVVAGIWSAFTTKVELFPQFSLDMVTVRVPFLGASPEEVEELVVVRIEEALQGVNGIKEINSVASEGYGSVTATVEKGYDVSKLKDDIKTRVDAIPSFPANTERPIVEEILIQKEVIRIAVYGDADEADIKHIANRVRDELTQMPEISQVSVEGVRPYEVSIEVSEDALRNYNLTFNQVVAAVRANSLDLPGGTIKSDGGEILLRTKEQAYRGPDFEKIVLLTNPAGGQVTLDDVATIKDGFADTDIRTLFNGKPAATVLVKEVGDENPLKISERVYEYVEEAQAEWVPDGVQLEAWSDTSYYLQGRIDMLLENGKIGFVLVLISLAIFLRPSLALFVALGIPVSFLATLAIAPLIGITINLLSLFAFILVLGIVVDDAIVVGESVFTEFQKRGPGTEASIIGTKRVSTPVTFAVITTMVAFVPIFLLPGMMGKFMGVIPFVVIPTLAFSLVQSKLVLPYHLTLCHVGDKTGRSKLNLFSRFQRRISDGLERFIENIYQPVLRVALRFRYYTVVVFTVFLLIALALPVTGIIRFVFFPSVPSDYVFVGLTMVEGTPSSETQKALGKIESALETIRQEDIDAGKIDPVKNKGVFLGFAGATGDPGAAGGFSTGSNLGQIILELAKSELRDSNATELVERWRAMVGELPGAKRLNFNASASGPVGLPVDIRLTGRDFTRLKAASLEIQDRLKDVDGLFDVHDSYPEGKRELKIRLKDNARALGLNAADLGSQIRSAFYGAEVQRVQRDKEDVKVMVRYPKEQRDTLEALESMRIVAPNGARIPIHEVAEIEVGAGYPSITRIDRNRVVSIQADSNKAVISTDEVRQIVYEEILPEVLQSYPDIIPVLGGEAKDLAEARPVMLGGAVMVLVLIYALLAIPFKSYLQPMIVISVIPFGIAGAIFGHLYGPQGHGFQDLSMLSFLGIIAMAGVVVNDSLVLVERVNSLREAGNSLLSSVRMGGMQRFRAILLTSVTTFVGLIPILHETSLQAQFLIPMATSLAFGVLFATLITLFLVPCAYLILEDAKRILSAWWRGLRGGFAG
ncbi:efflux RND transporter permease subunit [Pelagicoccus sp. SDUM812003]|uniref:efflux RND transporter permease subunit n=1 Tax=Pelagicoccus sp. SDUM812003 TaxID=3041267 RepID=UPI00280C5DCD|nr:efflux RND transporter permease subunit [Pelagicoccus sp. SDUM812003]MDQ8201881.1 efflux RND transporter permease subunit [Pelagicoccus sp. SDUM812003]